MATARLIRQQPGLAWPGARAPPPRRHWPERGGPAMAAAALSSVLARVASRLRRGAPGVLGGGGGGAGRGGRRAREGAPADPRARGPGALRTPRPRFPPRRGEERGAHTQRLLKAPREASDAIGDFASRNLAMPRNPPLAHHPGLPAHLCARGTGEKRKKVPRFLYRGRVSGGGTVPPNRARRRVSKRKSWPNPGDGGPFS